MPGTGPAPRTTAVAFWKRFARSVKPVPSRTIQLLLLHPSLPVDIRHNVKIFREKLAVWAQCQREVR